MAEKNESHIDCVWEVIAKAGICMMVTRFAGGLRARPLEARPERDTETIWFLTDVRGLKDDEIEANPNVCLTFVYAKEKVYLSITGKAFVSRDPERAKALWNEEQQVWWPGGPEDPNLLVMKIEPERAEMWDGAGKLGGGRVRIRQGAAYRHQAQYRREAQSQCRNRLTAACQPCKSSFHTVQDWQR